MDGSAAGVHVAPPIILHPVPRPHKRVSPWQHHNPSPRRPAGDGDWNPNLWSWDSTAFVAKPAADVGDVGGGSLALKLGGEVYSAAPPPRPSKRVRSGSPGGSTGHPACQVDECGADLSGAKDYHRRHKVCEVHSKMTKAVVAKQLQRFCQQCSRFHPLSEFDEGKRSCRRRLAGHNWRRRKTQTEDASSWLPPVANQGNRGNVNLDVANLLTMLGRLQGKGVEKQGNGAALPDRERVIQILGKLNTLPNGNAALKLVASACFDLNGSQATQNGPLEQSDKGASAPSTMDLLAVLSSALATSSPESLGSFSQGNSDSSSDDKVKKLSGEIAVDVSSNKRSGQIFPFNDPLSQVEISRQPVCEARPSLSFQLFSSAEHDSPPKVDYRSPSSSPPVTQKLFPLHSERESVARGRPEICMEDDNAPIETSTSYGWTTPLDFFKESERQTENAAVQSFPRQTGYTSSSGSDQSPSSSSSDSQERTERVLFKLFDKEPSKLPGSLRTQILNWLSLSPSDMESYIRPGCLVLSVYVSMPSIAWKELEKDFLQRVSSLVHSSDSEFWRSGRFFVHTNRLLALHNNGNIHLSKSWRKWSGPELTSVTPVAVVSGQETSLLLRGRNLTIPGTKIHCTYSGGYTSKEVYSATKYDESVSGSFSFPVGFPNVFGRCFIEVENGFKGNSFPVIVADAGICQELRALESAFEENRVTDGLSSKDQVHPSFRSDALHFLYELGWLFQRKSTSSNLFLVDFSCARYKFLFSFSVERDWSALVRTLLDMLVERSLKADELIKESLEMLVEIQLLSRAVRRKCRKMVNLLVHYSVKVGDDDSNIYLFPPNSVAPGGLTPLHLAASMLESEDIVDALTNDPQQIGLSCWSMLKDDNDQSPYMYASMRSNHSYNTLVARKLVDRKNNQVSVMIGNKETSILDKSWIVRGPETPVIPSLQVTSCARCAILETRRGFRPNVYSRGLLQRPYAVSMLAIAAVCVCVCLFLRGSPMIGDVAPFKWENLDFGPR